MAQFQPISEAEFARAAARADKDATPFAVDARFDRRTRKIKLKLSTGIEVLFDGRLAHGLEDASDDELAGVTVEGAGDTISFPHRDAYFTVSRLLEGFFGPMEWARRERRAAASRENGKKGGRPRKVGNEKRAQQAAAAALG